MQRKSKLGKLLGADRVIFPRNRHVAGVADLATCLSKQFFQPPRRNYCPEDVDERDVSGLKAVKNDDVAHQVGIRLLPERFLAFAPDGGNDRSNIESLRVGIEVVVQRVVANVRL